MYKKSYELLSLKDNSIKKFPVDEYVLLDTEDTDKKYLANKEDIENGYKKLELDETTKLYTVKDVMVSFIYNTSMSNAITPVKEIVPRLGVGIRQAQVTKKEYDKVYKESLSTTNKSVIIYDEDSRKLKLIEMSHTETVENGVVVFKRDAVTKEILAKLKTVKGNVTYNGFVYTLNSNKYLQPVRSEDITYFMNQAQTAMMTNSGYVKRWKCFIYGVANEEYKFLRDADVYVEPTDLGIPLAKFTELAAVGTAFIEAIDVVYRDMKSGLDNGAFSEEELKHMFDLNMNEFEKFFRTIISNKNSLGIETL